MSKLRSISYALLTLTLFGTAGLGEMTLANQAQAQTQTRPAPSKAKFSGFLAPTGRSMPKDSEGGASRGRCLQNRTGLQDTVTLLTPQTNSGLTASARPSFMAKIDQTSANQVFFSLKNEDESYFFEMTTSLPEDGSDLVKFSLPDNAPPLQAGEQYRWSVAVICGSKLGPDSPWASGWIERVETADADAIATLSPLEQASYYGKAGLWYDTVAVLASHRENQGVNADSAWTQLLHEGGIKTEAQEIGSIH